MITYKGIQEYVKSKYGFTIKTCWIAHVKEVCGLPLRRAHNRHGPRKNPCPDHKIESIKDAFKHFNIV